MIPTISPFLTRPYTSNLSTSRANVTQSPSVPLPDSGSASRSVITPSIHFGVFGFSKKEKACKAIQTMNKLIADQSEWNHEAADKALEAMTYILNLPNDFKLNETTRSKLELLVR